MGARTRIALGVLGALGIVALIAGRAPLFLWMLALSILAGGELFRVSRSAVTKPSALVGLVGIATIMLIAFADGEGAPPYFPAAVAGTIGASFIEVLLRRDRSGATRAVAFTVAPVLVAGVLAAYVVALRSARQGARLAGALVIMWAIAECAMALHAWRRSGIEATRARQERTGVAVLGGMVGAMVAALAWPEPFAWADAIVLGMIVGLCTAAGHLMSAMIVEAADPSRRLVLVPLVDGLFVSAPVFFYVFRLVGR